MYFYIENLDAGKCILIASGRAAYVNVTFILAKFKFSLILVPFKIAPLINEY